MIVKKFNINILYFYTRTINILWEILIIGSDNFKSFNFFQDKIYISYTFIML